jgi:hypothetical protein
MKALYQYKPPRPFAPGGEVAGIVDGGARADRPVQGCLRRDGRPAVTERFPLERGGAAIGRLGARDARGKMVVMMG